MTYIDPVRTGPSTKAANPTAAGTAAGTTGRPVPVDTVTLSGATGASPGSTDHADASTELLAALGDRPARPSDIGTLLAKGLIGAAVEAVARMSGVPTARAIQAYRDGDVGMAMSQLGSIGVDPSTAAWLLQGMGRTVPGFQAPTSPATAAAAYAATDESAPDPEGEAQETMSVDMRI